MSIKRISELDIFHLSTFNYENQLNEAHNNFYPVVNPDTGDMRKLSPRGIVSTLNDLVLFEISLSCNEDNEAVSYYLSKKVPGGELMNLFVGDIYQQLSSINISFNGYFNLGDPNANLTDYAGHTVKYDNRETIEYDDGTEILEFPNRLCCMIPANFTNLTYFHNKTEFHNEVSQIGVLTANSSAGVSIDKNVTLNAVGGTHENPNLRVKGYSLFEKPIDGIAMSAWWADLAEMYKSDMNYDPGTLIKFGGEKEITISDGKVANAIVTSKPGFVLNSLTGFESDIMLGIALVGRVPVKIVGPVKKFDRIVVSNVLGCGEVAVSSIFTSIIGIALESNEDPGIKLVECSVKLNFD